jgi:hypothetical protein
VDVSLSLHVPSGLYHRHYNHAPANIKIVPSAPKGSITITTTASITTPTSVTTTASITTVDIPQSAALPRGHDIDTFIYNMMDQYSDQIQASGVFNQEAQYPLPNLSNEILPMFTHRWVEGRGQHTTGIYQYIESALRLASRLLIERYPLLWFSHLTSGKRRHSRSGTYIVPISYSTTADAIQKARQNVLDVGEVVTLVFSQAGHCTNDLEGAYGITNKSKSMTAFR